MGKKSAYMDQLLEVANDLTIPSLPFIENNANEDVDQSPDFNLPIPSLPFIENNSNEDVGQSPDFNLSLDLSSLDVKLESLSTGDLVSQDKPEKSTSKRKNKKSSKNHKRDHTKSPSSRK